MPSVRSEMENPAFLDSDQSMYESAPGAPRNMSQRRPHHLPAIHHAHAHNPRAVGIPQHIARVHNGRVLGVTGIPGNVLPGAVVQVSGGPVSTASPTAGVTTTSAHYPDPSLPPLCPAHLTQHAHVPHGEPMYSCQAPRGHDHVYQCPGHRSDHLDHREHSDQREHLRDPREHHVDPRDVREHLDPRDHRLDPREHPHMNPREQMDLRSPQADPRDPRDPRDQREHRDPREHLESRDPRLDPREHRLDPGLDQRPDYHYGGSDYSSTEPIYAQPHLYPRETGAGTPTLSYSNARGSLRAASAASSHLSTGTPAKYLVRTDSCGNSTSSSILPTVSALLAREPVHNPPTPAHNSTPSLRSSARRAKGGSTPTPAKLKRQGLFRVWKVKFMRGEGGRRRVCVVLSAVVMVLLLLLGALATVLYLTLGGGLNAIVGTSPKLVVTETGSSVVEGEFRITNQNFWPGLEDPTSEEYRAMAQSIENELDMLFRASVWAHEYNHSQVISLSEGSLLVRAELVLNTADVAAAQKLGTVFLRGLHNRHGHEWLGQYSVDITSIRFTEVLVDTLPSSSTPPPSDDASTTTVAGTQESSTVVMQTSHHVANLNVGWGEWSPWSPCSPCSPQYDQIRTRDCRLDAGQGLLVNSIEPCLPSGLTGPLHGSGGDMETRPCQCHHTTDVASSSTTPTTTTTSTSSTTTTITPIPITTITSKLWREQSEKEETDQEINERLCDSCLAEEVCVGLQGEPYPTCRPARDAADRTGCGGLCALDTEVCQALGSRAFQCHSASLCLHDEWRCADGLCIPLIKRCDGHMNCYDQSDEQHCQCGPDEFQCGNNTSCLPVTAKCDGKMDCWDGSDEANCTTLCPNPDTQFTCRSSQCIPQYQFCDGLADCRDGSDEPFGCSGRCLPNEYQCWNGRCIPAAHVCDGRDSCGDGSDEQDCNRPLVTLTPGAGASVLNETSARSLTGFRLLENSTVGSKSESTIGSDIWLFDIGDRNQSKLARVDAFTADPRRHSNASSVLLYLTEPRDVSNPTLSQAPSDANLKSHTEDSDRYKSTTGVKVPQTQIEQTSAAVPYRDWRRTLQVMPRMEDYMHPRLKSRAVSSRDPTTRSSSSVIHEIWTFHDSDTTVSNMDMQGNKEPLLDTK